METITYESDNNSTLIILNNIIQQFQTQFKPKKKVTNQKNHKPHDHFAS